MPAIEWFFLCAVCVINCAVFRDRLGPFSETAAVIAGFGDHGHPLRRRKVSDGHRGVEPSGVTCAADADDRGRGGVRY